METQGMQPPADHRDKNHMHTSSLAELRERFETNGSTDDDSLDTVYKAIFAEQPQRRRISREYVESLKKRYIELEKGLLQCNELLKSKTDIDELRSQPSMAETADAIEQERVRTWNRELSTHVAKLLDVPPKVYEAALSKLTADPIIFSHDALIASKRQLAIFMGHLSLQVEFGESMPSNRTYAP